ncbi:MAG: hypothetical protein ACLU37_11260 [Collinsella sp.]
MSGVYEAIAVRDIVNRERGKGKSAVTDPSLLRHVANSWRTTSATSARRVESPAR